MKIKLHAQWLRHVVRRSKRYTHKQLFFGAGILAISVALLIIIVLPHLESRRTYNVRIYVAPTGSDFEPGTRLDRPLKTLQHALKIALPGDTIELQSGIYHQSVKTVRNGSPGKPIVIMGPQSAELIGNDKQDDHVFEINHSYITLDGFHINGMHGLGSNKKDYRDKLIYVRGTKAGQGVHHVAISHLTIENAGGECVRIRYLATQNEISSNTIRHCGVYDFQFKDGGKNGEGIYIGTAPEQRSDGKNPTSEVDASSNNHISGNTIQTYGNECVDIKEGAHHNVVENNDCSEQQDPKSGGLDARGNHNTFRFNKVHDNRGVGVRLGGDGKNDGLYNEIYGNTITDNAIGGIRIVHGEQSRICGNNFAGNRGPDIINETNATYILADPCIP